MNATNKYNTNTTNTNLNKKIIALFPGNNLITASPKLYQKLTGTIKKANILNQCIHYTNKSKLKEGWFWRSYEDWVNDTCLSERTLRRIFTEFESKGWISKRTMKISGVRTLIIKPHIDKICDSIAALLAVQKPTQTAIIAEENPCTKITPSGQNGRTAKRPKWPVLSIEEQMSTTDKKTNEDNFVFDLETDKEIIERLGSFEKPDIEKRKHELLKEIFYNVQKNFRDNKWKGINGTLSLIEKGRWGTPGGYVDQDKLKAEKEKKKHDHQAFEAERERITKLRSDKYIRDWFIATGQEVPPHLAVA